ncbi:hypothetical protein QMK19_35310 [Streptomyces sp. H10-C2]|uniref:hypothetical protein n=1 Tax=unclassified Streptomyces TaxID=2593676 RepID=UPI0024B9EE68|nr:MULTISPECIES: hypothetical protein [unclassified Streptomyces]MDJ0345904.1 hypothetical protein [Streptomyces sp. PH10-H1]MDJ0374753.1 hypothetical protein [Streptomyces sp. H10-C2]
MRMTTDDELYRVDDVFLGPARQTLPFRVRYRAYGIGGGLYALVLALEIWTGLIGFWPAVYGLLIVVWLTTKAMSHIDHDRTVKSAVTTLIHEISAPRTPRRPDATTTRPTLTEVRRHTF